MIDSNSKGSSWNSALKGLRIGRISFRYFFLFLFIPLLSIFLHWKIFDRELSGIHAWRQTQTAQNILNFYRHDSNILNPSTNVLTKELKPTIYRNEFPIMQWTIAMIMRVTSDSVLVIRICMFVLGIFSIFGMYTWLRDLLNSEITALAGAWAFAFSPVFYYYTMNPLPDNLALCGSIWSLAFFTRYIKTASFSHLVWSAFFMSLAVAAKLPYIVLLGAQGSWLVWSVLQKRFKKLNREFIFALVYLVVMVPALLWYAWVIPTWSNTVTTGIFLNNISADTFYKILIFHLHTMFPITLLGYVALIFLLVAFIMAILKKSWKDNRFIWLAGMGIGVVLYFIFEFNVIGVVHDYYMMPFLPVLYVLVAFGIMQFLHSWGRWLALVLLMSMPVVTHALAKDYWSVKFMPHVADVFNYHTELRKAAPADAVCVILNDFSTYIFSYLIDKQGFVATDDFLPAPWVKDMIINYNTTYMYSTSRVIESDPEMNQYFESMVLERGNVRVYKLKNAIDLRE
jgi:4-amino-4-deoxy-L-arabinose transferase-like glycosyltransferase